MKSPGALPLFSKEWRCNCAWYHLFNDVINTHVPLMKKRVKNETQPKWFTSELQLN